jgi:hypothetical protein
LEVVFEENLDGVATDGLAAFDGAVQAAGNGHVGADMRHGLIVRGPTGKSNA